MESPEPQYVWVKYAADELPAAEGLEYVGDYGAGTPVAERIAVASPAGAVDVEALADAVAARLRSAVRHSRMLPTSRFVTTAHAAAYCDMSLSGFKNAARRGRASPAGRRGGDGDLTWEIAELDRFMAARSGGRDGVGQALEHVDCEGSLAAGGVAASGWRRGRSRAREGFLRSGRLVEIKKYLPEATANVGLAWLEGGASEGAAGAPRPGTLADSLSRIRRAATRTEDRER